MKERGIIFSARMVRAIIDGRKTQTRRVIVPQPQYQFASGTQKQGTESVDLGWFAWRGELWGDDVDRPELETAAPVQPDDWLWVRETWGAYWDSPTLDQIVETVDAPHDERTPDNLMAVAYKATETDDELIGTFWRSPIHMYKFLARLWLRVTDVYVQRLDRLHGKEVRAEGFSDRHEFFGYWNKLHAGTKHSWQYNPWVWVYEFEPELRIVKTQEPKSPWTVSVSIEAQFDYEFGGE